MERIILHRFETKDCMLCGNDEVNEYFDVNSNFIEYHGVYHSLREILIEALNFDVSKIFPKKFFFNFFSILILDTA